MNTELIWLALINALEKPERKAKRLLRKYFEYTKETVLNIVVQDQDFNRVAKQIDWNENKSILVNVLKSVYDMGIQVGITRADHQEALKNFEYFLYEIEKIKKEIVNIVANLIISTNKKHIITASSFDDLLEKMEYWLSHRTDTIARTELIRASNIGYLMTARFYGNFYKRWLTALDEKVCPVCSKMNGEIKLASQPFSIGIQFPPAHPNCRCTIIATRNPEEQVPQPPSFLVKDYIRLSPEHKELQTAINIYLTKEKIRKIKRKIEKLRIEYHEQVELIKFEHDTLKISKDWLNLREQTALAIFYLLVDKDKECRKKRKVKLDELTKEELFYIAVSKYKKNCLEIII